jgi:hypothetical protein
MTMQQYDDNTPDIEERGPRPSTVLQALSPAVAEGSDYPEARPGDLLFNFEDRSERLYKRVPGVKVQLLACVTVFVEWSPERSAKKPPVAVHDYAPLDAQWQNIGGRSSFVRHNGNKIEKTIHAYMLVEGFRAVFGFKSTAHEIGERLSRDADKVRVTVDGAMVRMVGAFYQLSSEIEKNDRGDTWWKPTFQRLGIMGAENGPTIDEVRRGRDLRFEFKTAEDARKTALSAPTATPALTRSAGSIEYSTGVKRRSWADPQAPGPIIEQTATKVAEKVADPIDDEDLPF